MHCAGLTDHDCDHEVQDQPLCQCCSLIVEITDDLMLWVRDQLVHGPVRIHL